MTLNIFSISSDASRYSPYTLAPSLSSYSATLREAHIAFRSRSLNFSKQLVWSSGVRGTKERNYRERFELTESGLYVALRENWQGLEGRLDFIALKYGPVVKNFLYLGHWQYYVQIGRRDEVIGFLRYILSSMEPKELGEGDSIHLLSGLFRPSGQLQNDRMVQEFSELTEKDPNVQREVKEVRRVLKKAVPIV